jgi:hypothetical protein
MSDDLLKLAELLLRTWGQQEAIKRMTVFNHSNAKLTVQLTKILRKGNRP